MSFTLNDILYKSNDGLVIATALICPPESKFGRILARTLPPRLEPTTKIYRPELEERMSRRACLKLSKSEVEKGIGVVRGCVMPR